MSGRKSGYLAALLSLPLMLHAPAGAFQYPYGDRWYQNPLGFDPLLLHTRNGFLVPMMAAAAGLWLTDRDETTGAHRWLAGAGITEGYKYPHTTASLGNFGIEWRLRRWMATGVNLELHVMHDDFNSVPGLALRPFARFIPVREDRWEVWFEAGGGLVRYLEKFPKPTNRDFRRGTFLNGTTQYGIGGEWRFTSHASVYAALKHLHVSNGNTLGENRNPSHDSNGLFVGLTWNP